MCLYSEVTAEAVRFAVLNRENQQQQKSPKFLFVLSMLTKTTTAITDRHASCLAFIIVSVSSVFVVVTVTASLRNFTLALRNVSVTIPLAVKRGDNAILICNYDIENDTLYTVKWYRGRREFYRYTPKENPAWKIFSTSTAANGLSVDTTQSNASHVFIRNVSLAISGRYACEVSADAPSFHTTMMGGVMDVVELPTQRPIITGIHSRYRLGDVINGNCSSDYSKPAANLTWWINDIQVPPNYLRTYDIQKHVEEQMESAVLEINFIVTLQHFIKGRLKLKCSARIHLIYHAETEKYIEEDRPRILASGRSPEVFPYDHSDEFDDENGLYLTQYTNYHSSAKSLMLNLNHISGHMRNNNAADVISIGSHKNEVGAATTTATAAIELRNNETRQQQQHHHQHSFCWCRRCLNKPVCGFKLRKISIHNYATYAINTRARRHDRKIISILYDFYDI
ncbi:uncharacterized protein LOC101888481 [Musca domestica]|uniref:Uncharacterized protein LOC101888481 n=1 Tax=Musca domestica TaxID=7370 RepID=A0ABM3VNL4_MUSDO|nr:uncharacterized protein LOC101888481 [Musca domestica]